MKYVKSLSRAGRVKEFVNDLMENPKSTIKMTRMRTRMKLRKMNNDLYAKKIENIFLPSNAVIVSLIVLASYIFIFGPGAHPNFTILLSFLAFTGIGIVTMEVIRRKTADDIEDYNINFLRISLISLIIPLMLMHTVGLHQVFIFSTMTFLVMLPLVFFIRSKWKISGHLCTFTAVTTIMSMINGWFATLYLMLPVISWCRLKLKAHTKAQLVVGTLIGFLTPVTFSLVIPLI